MPDKEVQIPDTNTAMPADDKLADLFYKRTNCKCETAFSSFDSSSSSGPFRGFVAFGQDESGSTTIFGAFNRGFNPDCFYEFLIENEHGKVLYNVTRGLNVQVKSDGSTEAFTHKFKNINLDCHSNGILLGGSNMRDSLHFGFGRNCRPERTRERSDGSNEPDFKGVGLNTKPDFKDVGLDTNWTLRTPAWTIRREIRLLFLQLWGLDLVSVLLALRLGYV
ncbi:uncharacterized protein OCT59_017913 [Rhizophagus irregularis]|uniref:uncharacterized protein n=1 Tax=Rhizophagus irregularis TaxID=588596 RepID=UPI000CC2095E|nr:hypothetical protein OCT59_017913 [Rhizophagus irregularis]